MCQIKTGQLPLAPQGSRGAAVPMRDAGETERLEPNFLGGGRGATSELARWARHWPGGRGMRWPEAIAGSHRDHGRPARLKVWQESATLTNKLA